jgi:hypothetical protein
MKNHETKQSDSFPLNSQHKLHSTNPRARTGKIARLPNAVRENLNRRLYNGTLGKDVVPWLNALPEVQRVLAERFAGRPISEHNVSQWRRGGYQDWLRDLETRARVVQLTENYEHTDAEGRLGHRAESILVAELIDDLNQLHNIRDYDTRSARLHRICRDLARLQNLHCRGLESQLNQARACNRPRPIEATSTLSH